MEEKDLNYWKANAEEDYLKVPISVLRYIIELEDAVVRSYSEEDLQRAWEDGRNGETITKGSYPYYQTLFKNKTFEEWFEQFKKK